MLGDISPQTVRITQQAVVYPGRDHVTSLRVERFDGRTYKPVDMTAVTRVILSFPEADPVIVYDSSVQAVFTHVGATLTVDLSDYAMPASVLGCQIILYDAEHPAGQVLVDDIDAVVQFDFRNVSPVGGIPAPAVDYLTDAPIDGVTYARKDGLWVPVDALVSGVSSVNGQTGVVVLDAADVGADPAGTATTAAAAAVAAHTALADPHPQYLTPAEGNAAYDALGAAAAAVSAHESDTTPHAFVQNMSKAGFNLTAAQTAGVGEMVWNATDATMDLGLPGGVTLQAGQEFLLRGLNNSGATMADTTVVYISGAQGNRTVFSKAQANMATADKTIGVLTHDITNNQEGFATLAGLVRGIDTSAWAEGSELWLSAATAGLLTNIKPPAPNNAVSLGYVVRSHASLGSIYVRVAVRESIRELHDVVITAPTDGQVLVYDAATSTWVNEAGGGGSGEVNTASNLGTGSGLFAGKVGVDLQFKSLKAGAGVTLSSTATEVTIVASGAGGAVDSVNGQTGVVVLDTDDIAEGVSNLYFTNGRAAAAAPVQTVDGQTGAVSLSSSYAPLSHVGDGGAAHSNAVAAGAAGFMTGADKTKLDGIATGATQNSSDAFLRARGNHTGTQTASTISDFTEATQDVVGSSVVAGANVTVTYDDGTGLTTVAASSGTSLPVVRAITANETLSLTNVNTFGVNATTNNYTSTIPAQATVAWSTDAELHFLPSNTGDITITAAAGVSLNGVVAGSLTLSTQNGAATLKRTGADAWWLGGVIGTTAEQRTALGLGTAAVANLTTSDTDSTVGAALKVADFGVGATVAPTITTDLDTTYVGGLYRYTIAALNLPFAGIPGTVQVIGRSADGSAWSQLATACISSSVNRLAVRSKVGGTITPWGEAWLSTNTNAITSENGSFGYGTGSGGTVTQATSKATGVTLNKPSGQITTAGDALAANSAVSFTLTNNKIAANDIPKIVIKSGATAGAYVVQVDAVAAGSCRISIRNMTAGSLSETLVMQFNIEKGATA